MKQLKLSIAMLLAVGISFQSCKKDEVEKEPEVQEQPVTDSTNKTPVKITAEQVEGYKADVEDAGMKLVAELDGLSATKAATCVGVAMKKMHLR